MSTQLTALDIGLTQGWHPSQLEGVARDADIFVVGNVVSRGNPLMEAILDAGKPYISGPQWLYEHVLRDRWVLAVAGTHGKTTTSSMLAWILEHAGVAPGFLIGGVAVDFGVSARLPRNDSPFFVIEADEYDTAFFDKRSKFVHYRPRTAILNNLEYDHADIFPDVGAIEMQFHHLVRTVPGHGLLVVNAGEAALQRVLARGAWSEIVRFGSPEAGDADWTIDDDGVLRSSGEEQGVLRFSEAGRHNRLNALAAILAARHAGVPVIQSLAALAAFRGVKRRLESRGTVDGVTVYDDFAHHPTAIATTIDGLRRRAREGRILAVLEPRSNTMKLGVVKDALAPSLSQADQVFCYAHKLGWDVGATLRPLGARAMVTDDLDALIDAIVVTARSGDHVLVMSNGGFGGIHDKLLAALRGRTVSASVAQ